MAFTQLTRFTFTVSASLGLALGLASCVDGSLDQPVGSGASVGVGAAPGAGAAAGSVGAGATSSVGGSNPTGAGGATTSGGASNGGGTSNSGGTSNGGTSNSGGTPNTGGTSNGGTTSEPPCDDVPPEAEPGSPPNENCDNAVEWNWCGADWNNGQFCRKTCGDCTSSGSGGTGNGGTGNGGSGNGGTGNQGPTLPDITSGEEYHASRYWDCCKTHCATNAGAQSCGQNGTSPDGGGSSCNGGSAFACYSEAPRAISDTVSYGYVAVPNPSCNTCYHIQFTGQGYYTAADPGSQLIAGKHMIVKVSNTGSDVSNKQFDLMIPGGGVGIFTQGCQKQWGNIDFGAQYGGFYSGDSANPQCNTGSHAQKKACVKAKCDQLPAGRAREGCYWWVDWMQIADNPKFRFTSIQCPNDI